MGGAGPRRDHLRNSPVKSAPNSDPQNHELNKRPLFEAPVVLHGAVPQLTPTRSVAGESQLVACSTPPKNIDYESEENPPLPFDIPDKILLWKEFSQQCFEKQSSCLTGKGRILSDRRKFYLLCLGLVLPEETTPSGSWFVNCESWIVDCGSQIAPPGKPMESLDRRAAPRDGPFSACRLTPSKALHFPPQRCFQAHQ